VWAIHLNFRFFISIFISVWPDNGQSCLFEIVLGHQILNIYLGHPLTNVRIFPINSFVTSQVSQPYKSTDLTKALKTLISVSLWIRVEYLPVRSLAVDDD
jgi:hypothetical protein